MKKQFVSKPKVNMNIYHAGIMPKQSVIAKPIHFVPPAPPSSPIVEEPHILPPIEEVYTENVEVVQDLTTKNVEEPVVTPKLSLVVQQVILNMRKAKVNGWKQS